MLTPSLHILLIEDNPADVRLIQKMLSDGAASPRFDLTYLEALSEAKAYLETQQPDLILLDLHLSDADGLDAIASVLTQYPQTPVVILSGLGDEALALKAVQMGAQDYLPKRMLNRDLLVRTIRHAVERHRILQALAAARRREQQEAELRRVEAMAMARSTSVTGQLYGALSLRESLPELFAHLIKRYSMVLDLSLDEQAFRETPEVSPHLQDLAEQLGFVRAGPRDVTELHVAALNHKIKQEPPARAHAYFEEGRIVLIELMGHLLSYYRIHALGMPSGLGPSPSR